jgi:hypothetical protein
MFAGEFSRAVDYQYTGTHTAAWNVAKDSCPPLRMLYYAGELENKRLYLMLLKRNAKDTKTAIGAMI